MRTRHPRTRYQWTFHQKTRPLKTSHQKTRHYQTIHHQTSHQIHLIQILMKHSYYHHWPLVEPSKAPSKIAWQEHLNQCVGQKLCNASFVLIASIGEMRCEITWEINMVLLTTAYNAHWYSPTIGSKVGIIRCFMVMISRGAYAARRISTLSKTRNAMSWKFMDLWKDSV